MSGFKWYPGKFLFQILGQKTVSISEVKEKVLELAKEMGVEDKVVFDPGFQAIFPTML
jgi:hypothetical protein